MSYSSGVLAVKKLIWAGFALVGLAAIVFINGALIAPVAIILGIAGFLAWKPSRTTFDPTRPEDWHKAGAATAAVAHSLKAAVAENPRLQQIAQTAVESAASFREGVGSYPSTGHISKSAPEASGEPLSGTPNSHTTQKQPPWKQFANAAVFLVLGLGLLTAYAGSGMPVEPRANIAVRLFDPVFVIVAAIAGVLAKRWYYLPLAWVTAAFLGMLAASEIHFASSGGPRALWPEASLIAGGAWVFGVFLVLLPFRQRQSPRNR